MSKTTVKEHVARVYRQMTAKERAAELAFIEKQKIICKMNEIGITVKTLSEMTGLPNTSLRSYIFGTSQPQVGYYLLIKQTLKL